MRSRLCLPLIAIVALAATGGCTPPEGASTSTPAAGATATTPKQAPAAAQPPTGPSPAPKAPGEQAVKTPTDAAPAPASPPDAALPRRTAPPIWTTVAEVEAACAAGLAGAQKRREGLQSQQAAGGLATLQAYNTMLLEIDRIRPISELVANVHPERPVRDAAETCQRQAQKFLSDIKLDRGLFDALAKVDGEGLDAKAKRFLEHLLRDYRRAGVDKDEATRKRLAKLHGEMVETGQTFARNVREDKRSVVVKRGTAGLAGLPEDFVKAHAPGKDGKVRVTTSYPDFFPVQNYAQDAKLRELLYRTFLQRAYPANQEVLAKLLRLRYEYATTLGYPDWAAYNAEDKMVKTEKVIADFIERVATIGRPRMESDLKDLLERKRKDDPTAQRIQVWDRFYYVQKIRAERYGVDAQAVRAYFPYAKVKGGVMSVAQDLFGLRFQKVPDAPVWHPSVEAYDVVQGDETIARFYLDMHPRDGKYGHAAMFPLLTGIPGTQLPSASLVCNFPDPTKGGPALMEHGDVTTFFHEFGHLMHHLLAGRHPWATQSGINCEWDFVEAPSQLMEEWAWEPVVLARFAHHHETGEAIPAALVKKMRAADEFGKGVHVMRQMFYAALSLEYHHTDPSKLDLLATLKKLQREYNPYPYAPETYTFCNFGHLEGYSSMYYTYMWSLVLSKDLFTRFAAEGLMNRKTAMAYRNAILDVGGAVDADEMVASFLGRPYSFDAFSRWLSGDGTATR